MLVMTKASAGNPGFAARCRAALIHLMANAAVAVVVALLVTKVWYPAPLFELAKGRDIFLILVGCDIVLGPVLTLIIFDIAKKHRELVFDISIVVAVQVAALIYGITTLLSARPVYIVYNAGQFNVSLASEIVSDERATSPQSARTLPWLGPELIGAKLPEDREENNRLLFSAVAGRGDVFQMPKYFVPYQDVKMDVVKRARSIEAIAAELGVERNTVVAVTGAYSRTGVPFGLLPLVIRHAVALAVVNSTTGELLGIEAIPRAT
jgi:hypothetical protein